MPEPQTATTGWREPTPPNPPAAAPTGRTTVRGSHAATLVAMCLGAMVTFLHLTATVSALTTIQRDLRVDPTSLVWIPSAYTLMLAGLVLSAATLGSRYGRKRMFSAGVAAMMAGAAVVALATAPGWVIAGQLVAGAGGALILSNSLAILGVTFTDPHRRTEVITAWAAASGVGLSVGPLIAGALLAHVHWHGVFLSTVVLGLLALAVTTRWVAESRQPTSRVDLPGLLLGTLAVAAAVYALIEGGRQGYTSPTVAAGWLTAGAALVAFVVVELRTAAPMLDVRLFRSPSFSAVMLVAAVSLFGFTGVSILLVLFHERAQALSPLDTGWRMLVLFGLYAVTAFAAGQAIRRTGFKAPLTLGLLLGGLASLGLSTHTPGTPFSQSWPLLALFGAACGLVAAPATAAALASVAPAQASMAAAAVNTARQFGAVMGASLLGTLLSTTLIADLPGRLAAHGVPESTRTAVQAAVRAGTSDTATPPGPVRQALAESLNAGVQAGLRVNGVVFLAAAVLALAVVRNRPHRHQPAADDRR
ncbi:MFS family permease [Micromonospora sp. A200]|uniref:MFS transporter n=1 Tax=Micromonospora sp. A200 TaxID=2940568 RepID=UPI00247338EA|nr:MFS transporter [Micromonospora sp. A200]MDH6463810.1 MFS family permease [Micromonospora sp. A200]